MTTSYRKSLALVCGRESGDTFKKASEFLSLAQAKTRPGSGLELGRRRVGLPAVCAFLASERLGNNDVTKDVAQGVSCLNMPDFESALSTIRGALAGHLGQKRGLEDSYQALCDSYGLNEDALSWMEMVDKELHKSGELKSLEVDEESVMYMVFYWTCTALNIRSVKQSTIISKYEVPLDVFQDLERVLGSACVKSRDGIDKFVNESRGSRSQACTPSKTPSRSPRKSSGVSPAKEVTDFSLDPFSSPTKTPIKSSLVRDALDGSPSKRKAVLPPLPFMTPTKKQKTISPIKLNRIPVTSVLSTPSKSTTEAPRHTQSPTKTYGGKRSLLPSPAKSTVPDVADESECAQPQSQQESIVAEPPVTPVKRRTAAVSMEQSTPSTPSPRKAARFQASLADLSTPTRAGARKTPHSRFRRRPDSDVEMEDAQAKHGEVPASQSSDDEEARSPPCRHGMPIFADRLYYHYRDPRVMREREECEKTMKSLVLEHRSFFGDIAVC